MEWLFSFLQTANAVLLIIVIVILIYALTLIGVANKRISRLKKRYDNAFRGYGDLNIEELLTKHGEDLENQHNKIRELEEKIKNDGEVVDKKLEGFDEKSTNTIQRVGFHRFNAFDHMTNEMSFSLALLDSRLNGILITSIFGKDSSTTYAKEIRKGKCAKELSIEEEQALNKALNN